MCGVAGFWLPNSEPQEALSAQVDAMSGALSHRGPDGEGCWIDSDVGLGLGHRRLAVIDLSSLGHQPMTSACGRMVVVYNGELYNTSELRQQLERSGDRLRGHSDTEVVVQAIARWGVEASLTKFKGMFAFGCWDREQRVLTLVRDRIGIKPLFYGWTPSGSFLFGSELAALMQHPHFKPNLDREAVADYMRWGMVPAPRSIFAGVYKLKPGHMLRLGAPQERPKPKRWWCLAHQRSALKIGSVDDGIEQLDQTLRRAVEARLIADVPLGAFLSGGVDSSLIVAMMQSMSSKPVRTFSIRSSAADDRAERVAVHLGTRHKSLIPDPNTVLELLPTLPRIYDEPFADTSQIPSLLLARLARREVTVCLSGDGGDELFAGYNRYIWSARLHGWLRRSPDACRALLRVLLEAVPARALRMLPLDRPAEKLQKLCRLLQANSASQARSALMAHWDTLPCTHEEPEEDWVTAMMLDDLTTYLPDDILTKVDRASMRVGLEVRVPLLDMAVVGLAQCVPLAWKLRSGQGKWLLRQVLARYVPPQLIRGPKTGFTVPIAAWLRDALQPWADAQICAAGDLLDEAPIDIADVQRCWCEHQSGWRDHAQRLWTVLAFLAWRRTWGV